jgi:hypothetical protein
MNGCAYAACITTSEGANMSKNAGQVKDNFEKHSSLEDMQHAACKTGQAMLNEIQNDFKKSCAWVKTHPREDAAIAGGALIIGGVALCIKDQADGARAIAEGNKILEGEQIVSQKLFFEKLGGDGSVLAKIKLGDTSEEQFWIDAPSPKGQQLLGQLRGQLKDQLRGQPDGSGGFFKK